MDDFATHFVPGRARGLPLRVVGVFVVLRAGT